MRRVEFPPSCKDVISPKTKGSCIAKIYHADVAFGQFVAFHTVIDDDDNTIIYVVYWLMYRKSLEYYHLKLLNINHAVSVISKNNSINADMYILSCNIIQYKIYPMQCWLGRPRYTRKVPQYTIQFR